MKRSALSMVWLLMSIWVLLPGSVAHASPPTITPLHFDETFVAGGASNFCHFRIMRHDVGDGELIIRHTAAGDEFDTLLSHGTITFSANGHSIDGRWAGFDRDSYYSDGYYTYFGVGTGAYVVLPGVGPAFGVSGSMTFILDPDGNVISERAFEHDVFFSTTAFCSALAP